MLPAVQRGRELATSESGPPQELPFFKKLTSARSRQVRGLYTYLQTHVHGLLPSLEGSGAIPESAAFPPVVSGCLPWVLGATAVAAVAVRLSGAAAGLTLLPTTPARGVPTPVPHNPAGERFWLRADVAERLEGFWKRVITRGGGVETGGKEA